MQSITRRSVRRSSLAGREKQGRATLKKFLAGLEERKMPSRLTGRPQGSRIVDNVKRLHRTMPATFRHPTKKATKGRLAFVEF